MVFSGFSVSNNDSPYNNKQATSHLSSNDKDYVMGERVAHKQFGVGTVVCVLPQNEHKIIVTFESAGTRIFDMPYTSLKKYHQ